MANEQEQEVIIRNGVIWVSPKRYLRYIKEGEELLLEDLAKITCLKKPKPKNWIKIRNIINYDLRTIRDKQLSLGDRAMVFIRYMSQREPFENIVGKLPD